MNTSRKRAHSSRGVKGDKEGERDLGRNLASPRQRVSNICQRTDIFPRSLSQIHTILRVKRAIAYTDARYARVCTCAVHETTRTVCVWYINHKRQ